MAERQKETLSASVSSGSFFPRGEAARQSVVTPMAIVILVVLGRLVFSFLIDLLPEEAYYWNYAQHVDIGYLDHPPMVAWLIWLSTSLFGNTEFAVRLPAALCWLTAAFFLFRFTKHIFDRQVAHHSVLLLAVLPIYFSIGYLMTPDAPLYAAWMGCLYFLERALLANKKRAWWGVGICLGVGMLAKYTIGLLVGATFLFLLLDKPSRRWFARPEPYLVSLLALLLFSPVLLWNYHHEWASFVFQGPRRWSGEIDFSWHHLLGGMLVLLTPVGLYEVGRALWRKGNGVARAMLPAPSSRHRLFMLVYTLAPFLVFAFHSLRSQPKLNWTGPVWLAALPFVAANMSAWRADGTNAALRKPWLVTVVVLLSLYSLGLGFISLGMPGVKPQKGMPLPVAWREMGEEVGRIESAVQAQTGAEPVIVGMDKYWIASEMNFYDASENDTLSEIAGEVLFGGNSLMWDYWLPPAEAVGRDVLLISFDEQRLKNTWVRKHFPRMSDITAVEIKKGDRPVSRFFWRVGYTYHE